MRIRVREFGKTIVISPEGSIFGRGRDKILETVGEIVRNGRYPILLNMTNVERVNRSGIGQLILYRARAQEAGTQLNIYGCSPDLMDLIEAMKLERTLNVFMTQEEAENAPVL